MTEIAQLHDCIPLITTSADRAELAPGVDQVIYYDPGPNPLYKRATGQFQRWSGSAWVSDSQDPTINVLPFVPQIFPGDKRWYQITADAGTAFTINAPASPVTGYQMTFDIINASGGSMGTITWDSVFKLAGSFTNPADTKRRTISFYFNGTNWIELERSEADI